jgi:hypothetical protein
MGNGFDAQIVVSLSVTVLLGLAPLQAAQTTRIPSAFHGEWTTALRYCGQEGDDFENRLWVRADRVSYYEGSWPPKTVTRLSPRVLRLTYGPSGADEDDLIPPATLALSKDGKRLNGAYRRCPESTAIK